MSLPHLHLEPRFHASFQAAQRLAREATIALPLTPKLSLLHHSVRSREVPLGPNQSKMADNLQITALPPEILQTVFRNLSLFDLLRCQQVCKLWRAYLPGDDSGLHQAMFSRAKPAEPSHRVVIDVSLEVHRNSPERKFRLSIKVFFPDEKDGKTLLLHPVIKNLHDFERIIRLDSNPEKIPPKSRDRLSRRVTHRWRNCKYIEQRVREQESWQQMLVCVPAVQQLTFDFFTHFKFGIHCQGLILNAQEGFTGVTLGQVVEAIREYMAKAYKEIDYYE